MITLVKNLLTSLVSRQEHHHAALPDHDHGEELQRHAARPERPLQCTRGCQSQVSAQVFTVGEGR